jgi:hypothetical protein
MYSMEENIWKFEKQNSSLGGILLIYESPTNDWQKFFFFFSTKGFTNLIF